MIRRCKVHKLRNVLVMRQNQFLGAPALHIAGGTDEVQKNVAAERVLGLPREPRRDKDMPFEELPRS